MTVAPEMLDPTRYASLGELLEDALLTFKTEVALIEVDRKKETRRLAEQTTRLDPHTLAVAKAFAKPIPRARLREEKDRFVELLGRPTVIEALTRFVEAEDAMPYLPPRDARAAPRGVS